MDPHSWGKKGFSEHMSHWWHGTAAAPEGQEAKSKCNTFCSTRFYAVRNFSVVFWQIPTTCNPLHSCLKPSPQPMYAERFPVAPLVGYICTKQLDIVFGLLSSEERNLEEYGTGRAIYGLRPELTGVECTPLATRKKKDSSIVVLYSSNNRSCGSVRVCVFSKGGSCWWWPESIRNTCGFDVRRYDLGWVHSPLFRWRGEREEKSTPCNSCLLKMRQTKKRGRKKKSPLHPPCSIFRKHLVVMTSHIKTRGRLSNFGGLVSMYVLVGIIIVKYWCSHLCSHIMSFRRRCQACLW